MLKCQFYNNCDAISETDQNVQFLALSDELKNIKFRFVNNTRQKEIIGLRSKGKRACALQNARAPVIWKVVSPVNTGS